MKARFGDQHKARQLRKKGKSVNEISTILGASKGSVSIWVRNIKLTKKQVRFLLYKGHSREVIQKRVTSRLTNEKRKRDIIINSHKQLIRKIRVNRDMLLAIGVSLYWGEGTKSFKSRIFNFSNSDPKMIKVIMKFIRNICNVPEDKIRAHVHLPMHLNIITATHYWSRVSNIPESQFYKTTQVPNKSSKQIRDSLPYGTFSVQICSVDLFLKMRAWIEVIGEKVLDKW